MMPLYKLSHTDITTLEDEKTSLEGDVSNLKAILGDKAKLNDVIINDLKNIAKVYGDNRRTDIQEDHPELRQIDKRDLVAKEDVMVAVTRDGYVKRSSLASWKGSNGPAGAAPGLKSGDTLVYAGQCLSTDFMRRLPYDKSGSVSSSAVRALHCIDIPIPVRDYIEKNNLYYMGPGIGTDVAEFGGIRFFADSGGISDDQEETFKFWRHIQNPFAV